MKFQTYLIRLFTCSCVLNVRCPLLVGLSQKKMFYLLLRVAYNLLVYQLCVTSLPWITWLKDTLKNLSMYVCMYVHLWCPHCGCFGSEGVHRYTGTRTGVTLHELSLVDISNPPLQLLWVLGEELELGAVTLWVFPGVVVTNFSWKMGKKTQQRKRLTSKFDGDFLINLHNLTCL